MKVSWLTAKTAPTTAVGVILIGVIGSAIYDLFLRPGINGVAKLFFDLVTFGSQAAKDYSFSTAAMDPTSLPSLLLLLVLAFVAVEVVLRRAISAFLKRRGPRDKKLPSSLDRYFVLPFLVLVQASLVFVPLNIFNQSIITWRIFNANMLILAPALSELEEEGLWSQFSGMNTEENYRSIERAMEALANEHGLSLRSEKPW